MAATLSAEIVALRPRPAAIWVNPVGPAVANRCCHRITVGRLTPSRWAMLVLVNPWALRSTILARMTVLWGVVGARVQDSKLRCCSGDRMMDTLAERIPHFTVRLLACQPISKTLH